MPNTAVAKESSRQLWSRGFDYLADLVTPYQLSVPAIICAALLVLTGRGVGWDRRVRGLVAITLLAGLLQVAFEVRVGGTSCTAGCSCRPFSSCSRRSRS